MRFGSSRRSDRSITSQNSLMLTVAAASKWKSLEEFHHFHSACRIVDYMIADHRFFRFCRQDVQFELCYTPVEFGVQTRSIDAHTVPLPVFESNQLERQPAIRNKKPPPAAGAVLIPNSRKPVTSFRQESRNRRAGGRRPGRFPALRSPRGGSRSCGSARRPDGLS